MTTTEQPAPPQRTIRIEITNEDGTPWLPTPEELAAFKAEIAAQGFQVSP